MHCAVKVMLVAIALASLGGPARSDVALKFELDDAGMQLGHVAISVRDIDRSLKFYEALGFDVSGTRTVRSAVAKTLEIEGEFAARIGFIRRDNVIFELVEIERPRVVAPASRGVGFQIGLAHIALHVDDVDRVAKIIRQNGGETLDHTRTRGAGRDLLFCTDPDGTRIELARIDRAVEHEIGAPPRGVHQ